MYSSRRAGDGDDVPGAGGNPTQAGGDEQPPEPPTWEPPPALVKLVPAALLKWAQQPEPTTISALSAIARAATSSPPKTILEKELREANALSLAELAQRDGNGDGEPGPKVKESPPAVQHALTAGGAVLVDTQLESLDKDLRRSGRQGKLVMAQLRSQRGPASMAWLHAQPGRICSTSAVVMVLVALMTDPFRVSGDTCPFGTTCGAVDGPTCVHAIGCVCQHIRGHYKTHTQQKRCIQRILTQCNASWISNEDSSVFTKVGYKMDTAVAPGALSLASDEEFALKGVLLDTTVRAPTGGKYMDPAIGKGAAYESGYAAQVGEKEKAAHYKDTFDPDRWVLVPFVQESFGRFGSEALRFMGQVASHSAACRGGNKKVILRRSGIIARQIAAELSLCLARELGERVCAYVRGSIMAGRSVDPVSALLSGSS
jgi:hypothetical protein